MTGSCLGDVSRMSIPGVFGHGLGQTQSKDHQSAFRRRSTSGRIGTQGMKLLR